MHAEVQQASGIHKSYLNANSCSRVIGTQLPYVCVLFRAALLVYMYVCTARFQLDSQVRTG